MNWKYIGEVNVEMDVFIGSEGVAFVQFTLKWYFLVSPNVSIQRI